MSEKRLFKDGVIELGAKPEKKSGLIIQSEISKLHEEQMEAARRQREEEERRVFDQMLESPQAMRKVIHECIQRGKVSLSMELHELNDEQVKKTFIHLWGQAEKGKPTVSEISI